MARLVLEFFGDKPIPLIIFACVGVYVFWIVGYGFMMRHAFKTKMYGVPIVAASIMWSYEFCFLFIWKVQFPWWQALEVIWFIADSVLLIQAILYAKRTMREPVLANNVVWLVLWSLVASVALMASFISYYDFTDGVIPAVVAVCGVSVLFPTFTLLKPNSAHISISGQSCRALGDLCTALCIWLIFPWVGDAGYGEGLSLNNVYINVMVVVMLVSDTAMLLLIMRAPVNRPRPGHQPG